ILIHKTIQFKMLQIPDLHTIEAIGVSIATENKGRKQMLHIISLYVPNGQLCDGDELAQLYSTDKNNIILCGDFNARHKDWETNCLHPNRSGRMVADLIEKENNLLLATPPNLGTRQCPKTLKYTTIDLALMSPHLAATAEISRGPYIGSDHFPIHVKLKTIPSQSFSRPPSWNFNIADWNNWNESLRKTIDSTDFFKTGDPSQKYKIFYNALITANQNNNIKIKKFTKDMKAEPSRAWWNVECKKAVAQSRKARNACDPKRGGINCETNRAAWREKERKKKETIIKAKKDALNIHIKDLDPRSSPQKTWNFTKAWIKGAPAPDLSSSPLRDPKTGQQTTDLKERANILAHQYDHSYGITPDNPRLEEFIKRQMTSNEPNELNSKITDQELKYGLSNLKSNAMGQDKVHNMMMKNLSYDNKKRLLHLLNNMLQTAHVPHDWKTAELPRLI
ncbi:Uncharacterized protein APZ42_007763, partial [Daphnia magna]